MEISIYQVRDGLAADPGKAPDASAYGLAFEGSVPEREIGAVYRRFHLNMPESLGGRPMDVTDVLAVRDPETGKTEYWRLGDFGFERTDFEEPLAAGSVRDRIRVVLCEPGKAARTVKIGTDLLSLQRAVGGMIEAYYPFDEDVCIVCNDEGKLNGMRPCRAVKGEDGEIRDIIFGPFFICGCGGEEFESLTPEQEVRYRERFRFPEEYRRVDGRLAAVPYCPPGERDLVR